MEKEAEFLTNLVKEVVSKPAAVSVEQETDEGGLKLTLRVDQSDIGKVIGAKGRMAVALRTVMHAYGGNHNSRISVLIDEPDKK